jgi:nicotinate-nucleotide pyrophosphorylase (carboxylating)
MGIPVPPDIGRCVARALDEDVGSGDLTANLIPQATRGVAEIHLREPAIICGTAWVDEVFRQLDGNVTIEWRVADAERHRADTIVCTLSGPARSLLTGERTALNFLQLLSGTATVTATYCEAIAGTPARILDTRKTIPGLRLAQKYAVRCGGGDNHRIGLFDAVLIKENHIAAAGSIRAAVAAAKEKSADVLIEVEIETLEELREALETDAERLMLDDFTGPMLLEAVALRDRHVRGRKTLEASGGITLENVRAVAETGVDFISIGSLTKHVTATDYSMRFR